MSDIETARKKADKLGVNQTPRHIILCCDKKTADCASKRQMKEAWKFLKQRAKELGLKKRVYLSQSLCLDVCKGGPIAVVFPEGTWYGNCEPPVIDRILQEHILAGQIVEEYRIGQAPACQRACERAPEEATS